MNELKIFENKEMGISVRTMLNEDGSISINAEDTAIGFGWCRTEVRNGKEYASIMWSRMNGYCKELGFAHECAKDDYIPETLFYRLGMKAGNPVAEKFQNWLAFDVIPSIRKHGMYAVQDLIDNPDLLIQAATALKEERERNKALKQQNEVMKPKAEYFDELVDRNLLTNFRDTAKELGVKERRFVRFLVNKNYIYRDSKNKIKPYAEKNNGLFELKEFNNNGYTDNQTLITPKGRETFRLLIQKFRDEI